MSRAVASLALASLASFAAVALASPAAAESRRRRPSTGAELTLADLRWPASARSGSARGRVEVFATPGRDRIGTLASRTRVGWTKIVSATGRCRAWLAIEPRGWVCATDLEPSEDAPGPAVLPAEVVANVEANEHRGVVPRGADAYATRVAVQAGTPTRRAPGWAFLREGTEVVRIGDGRYYRTRFGYIAARDIERRMASTFAGVDLRAKAAPWPLAWANPHRRSLPVIARSAPDATAPEVARLARRDVVAVLEERGGFVRIADNRWVARDELRVARSAPRPDGVRADERWLDVDLDEQVLVAYEGDQPVYATLVSTGKGRSTPTAIHRIAEKRMVTRMKSPDVAPGKWDMPEVPFAMTFRKYYALHGAYWHDSFGKQRSAGCVNLTARDARFLFEFTLPALPAGWMTGEVKDDSGTPIRLRNRKNPNPAWTDFDVPPPTPLREPPAPAADDDE